MRGMFAILLVLFLVGCDGLGSLTDKEYVAKAQDYLDKGKLDAASIELKNALTQNPKNPQARWLLGKLYMDIGNLPGAEKELTRARKLGVTSESVLPLLAKVYLQQGKYDAVHKLDIGPSFSRQSQASLLTSRGIAYLSQGDIDQAAVSIKQALITEPGSVYALYGEAMLSISGQDFEKARELLNRVLELDAGYAQAWSVLGDLERRDNKPEAAEEAYTKAIDNRFVNTADRLKRALVRIQLKRYDEAEQDLDKLKKQAPRHPGVNYAQGLLHFLQQRYPEAQESFELALQANANYQPALFYMGAAQFMQGNREQAESYLDRFVNQNPGYAPGRKLLALLKRYKKDYKQVETLLRPLVDSESDDLFSLNLMANALISQGKTQEGTQLLERVVALQPQSAVAKTRLGIGLLFEGEQSAAVASLESAIELDPKFQQADMLLVLNYLRQKRFEQAQTAAEAFQRRQPESAQPYYLLGLALLGQQQRDKAGEAFKRALEVAPGDLAASQNLAALALQGNNPEKARKIYQNALKYHENNLPILIGLATLEAKQGDVSAMKRALEQAVASHPDVALPRILLARNYLWAGNREKALESLGDLQQTQPNNPALLGVMGEIQLGEKDFQAAKITLQRLVERVPNSAQPHFLLAKAYGGLGDQASVERELARTLELAPDHFLARLAATRLQIKEGNLAAAKESFAKLKAKAPENPDVLALEAVFSAKAGETDQALAILEQRFQANPTSKSLLVLTRFQWVLGKRSEAVAKLEKWEQAHPDDTAIHIALADAYLAENRNAAAIAQYEKILEQSADNTLALNNLAWQLRKSDPERALAYASKARAIAPDSLVVMDTLAAILLDRGEVAQAVRLNGRTLEKRPDSLTFNFRKATLLAATGKQDEALEILNGLLARKRGFPERTEAEALLKRMGGG